jgi:subtilisin
MTQDTNPLWEALRPQPTGGTIITFKRGVDPDRQMRALSRSVDGPIADMRVAGGDFAGLRAASGAVVLPEAGIAVTAQEGDDSAMRARLMDDDAVDEVRPEFWMFALDVPAAPPFADSATHTWGLEAVGALRSTFTGASVRACVLDTGLDFGHPDWAGREVLAQSFVAGEEAQDGQGHGTHCAGTVAGRSGGGNVPRYGVAPDAELLVGKVLNDQGSGREGDILQGMLWAIEQGSAVISMSLGRAVQPGEDFSVAYERLGRLALQRGSLIVAAAGNESSRRFGSIAPVGAPANSPSILAVAALDQALDVAEFSCGGINGAGGEVDLAAPGVGIFSSVPRPENYKLLRGTSMACPHVAGLAALWAESDGSLRGRALWDRLVASAQRLPLPARDVGAGLAQAPLGAPPMVA